ncbi:hypothetical protein SAMN05216344_1107 [Polaromonas sp. OV174]|uniref:hypothetical protein n=1 Tax=Polaromonas sp. OV174 TaxID=1855300 RepID=UPI0008F2CC74|nr:hypothetical protein [Polaromonas sp. OV174]SFC14707.1 hypothetical protein SAMN05216344_1107 [Polaromonas sp. OV174]
MAYAAYREAFGISVVRPESKPGPAWVVLDITVPSGSAALMRRALVRCPGAGILRCIPRLLEQRVRLEVRLPAHRVHEVMHCVMGCVPDGEIGRLASWREHLARHGLDHGG